MKSPLLFNKHIKCCLLIVSFSFSFIQKSHKNSTGIDPITDLAHGSDWKGQRLYQSACAFVRFWLVYVIPHFLLKHLSRVHRVGLGKDQGNHNFHGQRKTVTGENESIYFHPVRLGHDSEHVENSTSYKINYPLWQRNSQCSCQQETKISRESKQFCK